MKTLLVSSLLLMAAYAGPVQEDDLKVIIEIVNLSGAKWKAGHNFGENTTISSLKKLMGVKRNPLLKHPFRENHTIPDSAIPDSFDSRENWPECEYIRHIWDQGNCGSCWAVAAAGAFTDRLCIATNGEFTMPLSSEELLACCPYCNGGCDGGSPEAAWKFFADRGVVTGGDYKSNVGCQPYQIEPCSHTPAGPLPRCDPLLEAKTPKCQKKCTNPAYSKSYESDHHKVKQAYSVPSRVEEIQKEIMTHGPVEATYAIYSDFATYKSGIYHHVTGQYRADHAVKIIGWGVEDGTPYWLIANNWNKTWGDKGLFKILRGSDECGIESEIVAGIPKV